MSQYNGSELVVDQVSNTQNTQTLIIYKEVAVRYTVGCQALITN